MRSRENTAVAAFRVVTAVRGLYAGAPPGSWAKPGYERQGIERYSQQNAETP